MVRTYAFEVGPVVEQLDRILQMELAGVVYYTHYSFMVYGHARIPITSWLRDNASESLTHAQEAGESDSRPRGCDGALSGIRDSSLIWHDRFP
jgi:ferritin-like protein